HYQHVSDIADMGGKPERRRARRLGVEQRRPVQVSVPRRSGPHRRQRHQMREIQRMDERLADIGVDMTWERPEPGFDRIDALTDAGEAESVDDALDRADLLVCPMTIRVRNRD